MKGTLVTTPPAERALDRAAELAAACQAFAAAVDELAPIAAELAHAESRYRAALSQAGVTDVRPGPRQNAAAMLHGRLADLRPSVPYVSEVATTRSADALVDFTPPPALLLA